MEYRVIQNLKAANGDKSLFRQWHPKFTAALGQFKGSYEETVHRMAREIDLWNEADALLAKLHSFYEDEMWEASDDI